MCCFSFNGSDARNIQLPLMSHIKNNKLLWYNNQYKFKGDKQEIVMKGIVLKKSLENNRIPIKRMKLSSQSSDSALSKNKQSSEEHKINLNIFHSKKNIVQSISKEKLQHQNLLSDDNYTKANKYLSTIEDPLWKHVCRDIISIMGPVSFLEIWKCILGEPHSQNKNIDIYCQTDKQNRFIQHYSFVILGILKTYFPALKQINVQKTLP